MQGRIIISLLVLLFLFTMCGKGNRQLSDEEVVNYKEPLMKVNKVLVDRDAETILDYSKRHELNLDVSESGLWYKIINNGDGEQAVAGKVASINYKVSLLNGRVCYDSDSLGIKSFKIGQGGVETGLELGILMLKEGGKAIFIMPPHLAHGLIGDEKRIPPRSIIRYDVELVKISNY